MEYAMQLLIPILGGLYLGMWLHDRFGVPTIWTVILPILGMLAGLGIMYKRMAYPRPGGSASGAAPGSAGEKKPPGDSPDERP